MFILLNKRQIVGDFYYGKDHNLLSRMLVSFNWDSYFK